MNSLIIGALVVGAFMLIKNKSKEIIENESEPYDYADNLPESEVLPEEPEVTDYEDVDYEEVDLIDLHPDIAFEGDFDFSSVLRGAVVNCLSKFKMSVVWLNPQKGKEVVVKNITFELSNETALNDKRKLAGDVWYRNREKFFSKSMSDITLNADNPTFNFTFAGEWNLNNHNLTTWKNKTYLLLYHYEYDGKKVDDCMQIDV